MQLTEVQPWAPLAWSTHRRQDKANVMLFKSMSFPKYWIIEEKFKKEEIKKSFAIGKNWWEQRTAHESQAVLFSPLGIWILVFTLQLILCGNKASFSHSSYNSQAPSHWFSSLRTAPGVGVGKTSCPGQDDMKYIHSSVPSRECYPRNTSKALKIEFLIGN